MASPKVYEFVTTNKKRTRAEIRDSSAVPVFELELSFALKDLSSNPESHSIVMRRPEATTTTTTTTTTAGTPAVVIATCDISFGSLSTPIHLGFGNPKGDPAAVVWEDMQCRDKWWTNDFELDIGLGEGQGRRVFSWRRTHDSAGSVIRKLDCFNMKMIDVESGEAVARFVHNPKFGSRRGAFELYDFDGGKDWETIVVLSGSAVLEYTRKMFGWSF